MLISHADVTYLSAAAADGHAILVAIRGTPESARPPAEALEKHLKAYVADHAQERPGYFRQHIPGVVRDYLGSTFPDVSFSASVHPVQPLLPSRPSVRDGPPIPSGAGPHHSEAPHPRPANRPQSPVWGASLPTKPASRRNLGLLQLTPPGGVAQATSEAKPTKRKRP